jgi:branched-chain amino acid transport system substrate-binding protein
MRLAVVVLALTTLSACKKPQNSEIPVGAYLSLSGVDSTFGVDTRDGMVLAFEEINRSGGLKGKQVHVTYEDDKSSPTETTLAVRKLIERDNVVALLGEAASGRSIAGGLLANTSEVPMVTPSATAALVTKDREWVFRTCFTDDTQGVAAARFLSTEVRPKDGRQPEGPMTAPKKRIAILYAAQDTYSSGLATSFRDEIVRLGGEIVANKGYQKGDTSFRTQLAELAEKKPDVIYVPNYYSEMVLVARQAKEVGIAGSTFFGGDGWDAANLLEGAAAQLEGARFTNHYAPDVPWPASRHFVDAFRTRFGHEPSSGNALGYDAARLLADAIRRAPEVTRPAIRKALAETRGFEGATGTMDMDEGHNPRKPIVVVRVHGGRFAFESQLPTP